MKYRTYWWKTVKEVVKESYPYFLIAGVIIAIVGLGALLIFLGIKCIKFLIPIFDEFISFVILIGMLVGSLVMILSFFHYRYYKKYVKKNGVKK